MDDIIRIIKSLGNSGILIDVVSETVKHQIKRQEGQKQPSRGVLKKRCSENMQHI